MKICKKCKTYLSNESKFCNVCGEPQDDVLDDKFCSFCGTKMKSNENICRKCGYASVKENKEEYTYYKNNIYYSSVSATAIIVKVFMIISCVIKGIFIFPLAWCIPMTVYAFRKINEKEEFSLAFKICTLIFVDLVSGIIMLADEDM